MNCSTGKPGTPAYVMPAKECLSNMARLSLCGKLNLAIEKCDPYPFLIPYYGSKEFMTETALMHQIIQPFSVSQYVPLWEKVLSILLKNQKVKDQKEVNTVNKIFVPHELKTIEVDTEKKIFRINGEDFGDGCTGFLISCTPDNFRIDMEIDTTVRFVSYSGKGTLKEQGEYESEFSLVESHRLP